MSLNRFLSSAIISTFLALFLSGFSLVFGNEFSYDSHGKRDPFVSATSQNFSNTELTHGELRLEGIVVDSKGQSYAIVNSEIVREGQVFSGFLLKKITEREVTFQKDDEIFNIPLRKDNDAANESIQNS